MMKVEMGIKEMAPVFKLLGDQTRLTIITLLQTKQCCVCELVEALEMSQPAISQHLRKLRDARLVNEERRGQWIYYSLNKEAKHYLLIQHILQLVPKQVCLLNKMEQGEGC